MTDLSQAAVKDPPALTDPADDGGSIPGTQPRQSRTIAARVKAAGLVTAPLLILVLCAVLFFYYQSLDLSTANVQQRSSLAWSTKLWPQTLTVINIAFQSTVLVILIAIPLGILLTRPSARRLAPVVLTIANSGQALPAYGLLVAGLFILGQGRTTVVLRARALRDPAGPAQHHGPGSTASTAT